MIYYELLEDNTIGRYTNNIKLAKKNGYFNENQIANNDEEFVFGYDNKRYLKGNEPIKPQEYIDRELLEQELLELHDWLDNYYDSQVKQYQRCQRLGIEFDKNIVELDNQAKSYQERIREIKDLLKQGK